MPGGFDDPRGQTADLLSHLASRTRDPVTARHLYRAAADLELAVALDTGAERVQQHFIDCARTNLRRANPDQVAIERDLREQAMEHA